MYPMIITIFLRTYSSTHCKPKECYCGGENAAWASPSEHGLEKCLTLTGLMYPRYGWLPRTCLTGLTRGFSQAEGAPLSSTPGGSKLVRVFMSFAAPFDSCFDDDRTDLLLSYILRLHMYSSPTPEGYRILGNQSNRPSPVLQCDLEFELTLNRNVESGPGVVRASKRIVPLTDWEVNKILHATRFIQYCRMSIHSTTVSCITIIVHIDRPTADQPTYHRRRERSFVNAFPEPAIFASKIRSRTQ